MKRTLRIALAQINTTVGDVAGNEQTIIHCLEEGKRVGADLVAFPELAVTGYPPEDLLLKHQFVTENSEAVRRIAQHALGITAVVGFADFERTLYNAAAVLHGGRVAAVYRKMCLPNYGVFDEKRYFEAGRHPLVVRLRETCIGLNICEDIWIPDGVTEAEALKGGAELIVNISSSPYHAGKGREREQLLASRARENRAVVAYVNLVGGQDELVFDGLSFVFDEQGQLVGHARQFDEDFLMLDLDLDSVRKARSEDEAFERKQRRFHSDSEVRTVQLRDDAPTEPRPSLTSQERRRLEHLEEIYEALVLGTRDYVRKNGFRRVVVGLSGGIDSALTAAIATDALGKENVVGVTMPSQYSSSGSVTDSEELGAHLGIELRKIPISEGFHVLRGMLEGLFGSLPEDVTEENLQARIRGILLMALSNKFGHLVLAPGNKSEMSVGYCTLYGDMVGGFAVIKDVPKTLVYKLANYRNRVAGTDLIPQAIIDKEPSAELRPGQKDADSLPPYEILDGILEAYVEQDKSVAEIVDMGFDEATVREVASLVDRSEYKRRQGPPGIKITPRAFGKDRRVPITNRYRE